MFAKAERLSRLAFLRYFAAGRRTHTLTLTLIYTPAPQRLVSVVVGKKVAKLAVGRNRVRRRIYASLRRILDADSERRGVFIVVAKPGAAKLTRLQLALEVAELLARHPKSR